MYDLLNERKKVTIDHHSHFDVKLSNEEVRVYNAQKTIEILFHGSKQRKASANDKNKFSSRSNAIFRRVSGKSHNIFWTFRLKIKIKLLDGRVRK